jgi:hypothetical protein
MGKVTCLHMVAVSCADGAVRCVECGVDVRRLQYRSLDERAEQKKDEARDELRVAR